MEEKRYMIKEAAKMLEVEPHVLRYWEEELNLHIKRNDLGHRYYLNKDIDLFNKIQMLKTRGIGLKAIKELIARSSNLLENKKEYEVEDEIAACSEMAEDEIIDYDNELDEVQEDSGDENVIDFKMVQLQKIMNQAVVNALKENNELLADAVKTDITDSVVKHMDDMLKEKEEREEERYKRLDEVLRAVQRNNEKIANSVNKNKKKRRWFK